MNTYAANVPRATSLPLYFAGAEVLELFPVVSLLGNVSIGVGALSYAGQFNVTAVADREICPDLEIFSEGMRRSLDAVADSVPVRFPVQLEWRTSPLAAPNVSIPLNLSEQILGVGMRRRFQARVDQLSLPRGPVDTAPVSADDIAAFPSAAQRAIPAVHGCRWLASRLVVPGPLRRRVQTAARSEVHAV